MLERLWPALALRIYLWRKGKYEAEIDLLPYLIDRHKNAIDIGANVGYFIYHILKCTNHVVAFEPSPHLARRLKRTYGKRITLNDVALSDKDGRAQLSVPARQGQLIDMLGTLENGGILEGEGDIKTFTVECKRLDDYNFTNIGFIKIDVEGHELEVLHGAQKTLATNKAHLLIEAEERHKPGTIKAITAFLGSLEYQGLFLHEGKLRPIEEFDPQIYQNISDSQQPGDSQNKVYINNFLFVANSELLNKLQSIFS
jgi:FkbM family methyltransferase